MLCLQDFTFLPNVVEIRSGARNFGCFQRRLFVCGFVCLSTRKLPNE